MDADGRNKNLLICADHCDQRQKVFLFAFDAWRMKPEEF